MKNQVANLLYCLKAYFVWASVAKSAMTCFMEDANVPNLVLEGLVVLCGREHDSSSFDLFIDLICPSTIKAILYHRPLHARAMTPLL